MDDCVMIVFWI